MRPSKVRTIVLLVLCTALPVYAQTAATKFESGKYIEQVEGDLEGAIRIYMEIAARKDSDRALAAKALLSAASCHDRLGHPDGRALRERIIRDFPEQREQVVQAQTVLAKLPPRETAPGGDLTTRRLASFISDGWYARQELLASDGQMAYVDRFDGRGHWSIVRRNLTTNAESVLYSIPATGRGETTRFMVSSRDGSRLAITQRGARGASAIVLIDTRDKGADKIDTQAQEVRPVAWSPDGKELLVLTRTDSVQPSDGVNVFSLALLDLGTRHLRPLREIGRRPFPGVMLLGGAYNGDGTTIAYDVMSDDRTRRVIRLISSDGANETTVVDGPGNSAVVGFAPGGDLLFLSDRSGTIDAYAVSLQRHLATGNVRLIKDNVGLITSAGWSGANLLYYPRLRRSVVVGRIDMGTGEVRDRRDVSTRHVNWLFPALLSPDGALLVYGSDTRPLADGRPSLIVRDMKSTQEREIELYPQVGWLTTQGAWSLNGKSILLSGYSAGGEAVTAKVDVATGQVRVLQGRLCTDALPDGAHVLCRDRESPFRVTKVNWETQTESPVLEESSGRSALSPNGRRLAYLKSGGAYLAVRDLDSAQERILWQLPSASSGQPKSVVRWLGTDRVVVLYRQDSNCCALSIVGTEVDSSVSKLDWINQRTRGIAGVDWTDGRLWDQPWPDVAFGQLSFRLELWALENLGSIGSATTRPR